MHRHMYIYLHICIDKNGCIFVFLFFIDINGCVHIYVYICIAHGNLLRQISSQFETAANAHHATEGTAEIYPHVHRHEWMYIYMYIYIYRG